MPNINPPQTNKNTILTPVLVLYLFNRPFSRVESRLRGEFDVIKAGSLSELQGVLKEHVVFALLVVGSISRPETLQELRKVFSTCPKVKRIFYGNVLGEELAFQLSKIGCDEFKSYDRLEELVISLKQNKIRSTFKINPLDFGIDLEECTSYHIKKFFQILLDNNQFINYKKVKDMAKDLNITTETLDRTFRDYDLPPPKLILQWFKCYYAAYLLKFNYNLSLTAISNQCGFSDRHELYKCFKKLTDLTPGKFRDNFKLEEFNNVCLETFKIKSKNDHKVKK